MRVVCAASLVQARGQARSGIVSTTLIDSDCVLKAPKAGKQEVATCGGIVPRIFQARRQAVKIECESTVCDILYINIYMCICICMSVYTFTFK